MRDSVCQIQHKSRKKAREEIGCVSMDIEETMQQWIVPTKRPPVLPAGFNTISTLVGNKKAQLVVTGYNVNHIFVNLCHKMRAPYCIIKRPG